MAFDSRLDEDTPIQDIEGFVMATGKAQEKENLAEGHMPEREGGAAGERGREGKELRR